MCDLGSGTSMSAEPRLVAISLRLRSGNAKVTLPEARALLERAPALRELRLPPDAAHITAPAKRLLLGGGVAVDWPEPEAAAEDEEDEAW